MRASRIEVSFLLFYDHAQLRDDVMDVYRCSMFVQCRHGVTFSLE